LHGNASDTNSATVNNANCLLLSEVPMHFFSGGRKTNSMTLIKQFEDYFVLSGVLKQLQLATALRPVTVPTVRSWMSAISHDLNEYKSSSAATCSRWFFARGFFYPEDVDDTILRNVGSIDHIYTAPHPRRRHSS
jgi:hypothetical protein